MRSTAKASANTKREEADKTHPLDFSDKDYLVCIAREALTAQAAPELVGHQDCGLWAQCVGKNLGDAVEAICDGKRSAAAGHLALASVYANRLYEERDKTLELITPDADEQLINVLDAYLNENPILGDGSGSYWDCPFEQIRENVDVACSYFSSAKKEESGRFFLARSLEAIAITNWLIKYIAEHPVPK